MRTPKLYKLKSNDATNNRSPSDGGELTYRTSIDDLRNPDGRQALRQQLTGIFPEASAYHRQPSQESINNGHDMGIKDRLSMSRTASSTNLGQNSASTSSVDSMGAKRLSTVRESNAAIDVEQAIRLLQELKKTASPDDLVALHKALLPTRDSLVITPALPVNEQRSSVASGAAVVRQRSMLPAGLATRDGANGDLLRTQEEAQQRPKTLKKSRTNDWGPSAQPLRSKSSIAALDLANDDELAGARAITPSEELSHIGSYQPGTLRITNGAASPDPSIRIGAPHSADLVLETRAVEPRMSADGYATAPQTPDERMSLEAYTSREPQPFFDARQHRLSHGETQVQDMRFTEQPQPRPRRQSKPKDSAISGIPVPNDSDEASPRIYKRTRSTSRNGRQSREQPETPVLRSRDSSLSRLPLRVEKAPSKQSLVISRPPSKQSLHLSKSSMEPIRHSIDDGRVSPIVELDAPRYAQRWSQRASNMSQEYLPDQEFSQSPAEDKTAPLNRLSTVYDGEQENEDAAAGETREAALSRLNGDASVRVVGQTAGSRMSPNVSDQSLELPAPPAIDSGYASDESTFRELQRRVFAQASQARALRAAEADPNHLRVDDGRLLNDEDGDDVQSLYTLEQALRTPAILAALSSSSRPNNAADSKKHSLSMLRLSSDARGSPDTNSPDNAGLPKSASDSPSDTKTAKVPKKLQKTMPASVREQRKAKHQKLKESKEVSKDDTGKIAVVAEDEARSVSVRTSNPWYQTLACAAEPSTPEAQREVLANVPAQGNKDKRKSTEVTQTTPKRSISQKRRSGSRGRSLERARGDDWSWQEKDDAPPDVGRSWSISKKRSKRNTARSGSTTPKQSNFDIKGIGCGLPGPSKDDDDDRIPLWTDTSSVSTALGCGPYDISTNLFRRSVVPGCVVDQIQSPHQISTGVSRAKNGGLRGMDSGMASELARMKSRDVAIQNNEELYDRPRMATPKSRGQLGPRPQTAYRPTIAVEDRFPDGQGKPVSASKTAELIQLPSRPHSMYAESLSSIPPLPELPADVQTRVSKLDEMVAKRNKASAPPTPPDAIDSTRPSDETQAGYETESIAEAVRRAVSTRKSQEHIRKQQDQKAGRAQPNGPRQAKQISLQVVRAHLQGSQSTESIPIALDSDLAAHEGPEASSPAAPHRTARATAAKEEEDAPITPGWEQQAKLWRARRKSIGESLGKPVTTEDDTPPRSKGTRDEEPVISPSIVLSRYATPPTVENEGRRTFSNRPTDAASIHADAYRDLIGDDKENWSSNEDESKRSRPGSTQTFVTVKDFSDEQEPLTARQQTNSAYSNKSYQNAYPPIERSRSPGGRVRTPSGNFHPYTPADAIRAEHSRAQSLAKLTGTAEPEPEPKRPTKSLDVPRRKKSFHEKSDTIDSLIDRYSGGLQYGYEKGSGIGGSAGTRPKSGGAQRKSQLGVGDAFGLDLSDVPVMLRKVM